MTGNLPGGFRPKLLLLAIWLVFAVSLLAASWNALAEFRHKMAGRAAEAAAAVAAASNGN